MPNPIVNRRIVLNQGPRYPSILNSATAWYRGDSLITKNGSTVSAWGDRTGNGNTATQSTEADQPDYTASAIGGRPGLTFDGGNEFMEADSVASIHTGADKALTIVSVVKLSVLDVAQCIWSFGSSTAPDPYLEFRVGANNDVQVSRRDDASNNAVQTGGITLTTDPVVLSLNFSGTSVTVKRNGSKIIDGAALDVGTLTLDRFSLGVFRRNALTRFFNGDQIEHAIFKSALSTSNVEAIESYLSARYSIALS